MVHEAQHELGEEGEQEQDADDLVGGIEILALVVLRADHAAPSKRHTEEDETNGLNDRVALYFVPGTQNERAKWQNQYEDDAHDQAVDVRCGIAVEFRARGR